MKIYEIQNQNLISIQSTIVFSQYACLIFLQADAVYCSPRKMFAVVKFTFRSQTAIPFFVFDEAPLCVKEIAAVATCVTAIEGIALNLRSVRVERTSFESESAEQYEQFERASQSV